MSRNCSLTDRTFNPAEALGTFSAKSSGCGAIASFTGVARPSSRSGQKVTRLFLDHHPVLTIQSINRIAEQAQERFEVQDVHIIHRCGYVAPDEPIVFVAAASIHRRAAFDAVDFIMDYLKSDAFFWKCEHSEHGKQWVEPTDQDYASLAGWAQRHRT